VQSERYQGRLSTLELRSTLLDEICAKQKGCQWIQRLVERSRLSETSGFLVSPDGVLRLHGRVCVPRDQELRQRILQEAHATPYSIHPGTSKMYKDLRQHFWWDGLRPDVAAFVARCQVCQ
jgi:hypothetical protein